MAADLAEDLGIDLPSLSARVAGAIGEVLPDVPPNNPLDAGGSSSTPTPPTRRRST